MNYSKQIFEMIGIKPDEEFKLSNGLRYCLDKDLNLWYRNPEWAEGRFETADYSIKDILNGTYQTIKLPKKITPTKEEQVAIDYARTCGYNWLAKDDGAIYATAYSTKPFRGDGDSFWSYNGKPCMMIQIPISFISCADQEPYYIGDESVAQETSEQPDSFF